MSENNYQTISEPKMMSIKDLAGYKFEIPVYQRGFRWTRQQIKELIDDLYDFISSSDTDKHIYCLQNITVRKKESKENENVYEVIDGQQRLTAIWILIMAYMDSSAFSGRTKLPIYSLKYEEKSSLTDYVNAVSSEIEVNYRKEKLLEIEHPSDIDSAFIYDGFNYIIKEYQFDEVDYSAILYEIFSANFQRDIKQICVIWNEISPKDEDNGRNANYAIERFSNLNANKIPLTESELIKAYYINILDSEKIPEFSLQWEELERGLNDEDFWGFISSGDDEETRMDFLFRINLGFERADLVVPHTLSKETSKRFIDSKSTYEEWCKIVELYNTLYDWYSDYYFYHMIGLIIAIEKKDSGSIIKSLYGKYKASNKEDFKEELKERVKKEPFFKIPFRREKDEDKWNIESPDDILLDGQESDEISYKKNKSDIKPILLLFNISLLLNAYEINKENAAERFSFKIFKDKNNPIEIEHINPQHLEGKNSNNSDYTPENKKKWALATLKIIEDDNLCDELTRSIERADWSKKQEALINRIEDCANLHSLSNLTLLDKNLNTRYGDSFFNEKRANILAARFGDPSPCLSDEKSQDDNYYKQSVIFPGTMWVFLREFNTDNDAVLKNRWISTDRKIYIECIQRSIFRLLNKKDNESKGV